jgi:hypothetical protein
MMSDIMDSDHLLIYGHSRKIKFDFKTMFWILITKKQLKRWTLFLKYKGDNPRAADRV